MVGQDNVRPVVAVQVGNSHRERKVAGLVRRAGSRREPSGAVADENRELVVVDRHDAEVEVPVATEVGSEESRRARADGDRRPRSVGKASRSVAEEDRDVTDTGRHGADRDGEVGVAVAVEVGGVEPCRSPSGDHGRRGREAAGAVPEEHRDEVVELVRDQEVGIAVGVQVDDHAPVRDFADGERRAGRVGEAARAVAEQDRHLARGHERSADDRADVRDDQVELPVPVDEAGRHEPRSIRQ
jgi:hypothetical protein